LHDSELISFLRRIDKDDDGVLCLSELKDFLKNYEKLSAENDSNGELSSRRLSRKLMRPLREPCDRKIVNSAKMCEDMIVKIVDSNSQ